MLYHQSLKHETVSRKARAGTAAPQSFHEHQAGPASWSEVNIRYNASQPSYPQASAAVQLMKELQVGSRVKVCDIENGGQISASTISGVYADYYELNHADRVPETVVFPENTDDNEIRETLRTLIQYTGFNRSLPRSHELPGSYPGYGEHTMGNLTNPVEHLQKSIIDGGVGLDAADSPDQRKRKVAKAAATMAYNIVTGHYFRDGNGRTAIYSIYDILDKNGFYLRRTPVQVHAFLFGEENTSDFSSDNVDEIADWICENMTRRPSGIDISERRWSLEKRETGIRSLEDDRRALRALEERQWRLWRGLPTAINRMQPDETVKLRDWKKYSHEGMVKLRS